METECEGAKTAVTNTSDEMINAFSSIPHFSPIVRDEDMSATGEGCNVEETDWGNLIRLAREGSNSIFHEFKKYQNIGVANYYFEMFGWDPETQESRALVRDELGDYMGFVIIEKNYDAEFIKQFETKKTDIYEELKGSKGHISAFKGMDTSKLADKVWDLYKSKGLHFNRAGLFKAFIMDSKELDELKNVSDIVKDRVVQILVMRAISEPKPQTRKSEERESESASHAQNYKILKRYKDEEHLDPIIEGLEVVGADPLPTQVFELKCQKQGNLEIHNLLDISVGSVSNYFHEILQNWLGYAGEWAKDKQLSAVGRKHIMGGYNSSDPDCICYEPLEVHSIKTYFVFRINKALTEIAQSEIDYAIQHQCPLIMDAYECSTREWIILQVFPQSVNHQLSSETSCEVRNAGAVSTPSSLPGPAVPSPRPAAADPEEGTGATFAGGTGGAQSKNKRRRHRR